MKRSQHRALVASLALFVLFPAVVPGETATHELRVVSDKACKLFDAMPARVAALPNFSRALDARRRVRIVAIGSSSTEGAGASAPSANYPSQLQALLQLGLPGERFEVINLGIGGETAQKTVERLRKRVPELSPDLVVWQVGTNDAIANVPVADYEATVVGALKFLQRGHYDTMLVGMQWTRKLAANPHYVELRDATTALAAREGVTLVSRYDAMKKLAELSGREDFTGPDNLHMNDRGYRCLAEEVAMALAHSLDVPRRDGDDVTPLGQI